MKPDKGTRSPTSACASPTRAGATEYRDVIRLFWAYDIGERKGVALPRSIPFYLDLVSTDSRAQTVVPRTTVNWPPRYADLFRSFMRYRLTILVTADGLPPES